MDGQRRCLSLTKGRDVYVFSYEQGRESDLLASFVDLAGDDRRNFDWFDAAVLAYQMGRRLESELDPVL